MTQPTQAQIEAAEANEMRRIFKDMANLTIERCAQVADNVGPDPMALWIAAAIRNLKDETP